MTKLIINADDYGYSEIRNVGISECFKDGCVTSATLMVNAVAAQHAVQLAKDGGFLDKIGLHLNLTEGIPIGRGYQSLCNRNKELPLPALWGKPAFLQELQGEHFDASEVRAEIVAQMRKFQELTGQLPSHVDGHHHVHVAPGIREVFAEVMSEMGVHTTRLPWERDVEKHDWMKNQPFLGFFHKIIEYSKESQEVFDKHNLWYPTTFIGTSVFGGDMTLSKFNEVYTHNASEICEFMVHPGYPTGEVGGCGDGPDEVSQSPDRKFEMDFLKSKEFSDWVKMNNLELVSFRQNINK